MVGGFGIPGLGMLLFWGLFLILLVLLINGFSSGTGERSGKTAREILDERFACGEINPGEYEAKKTALT